MKSPFRKRQKIKLLRKKLEETKEQLLLKRCNDRKSSRGNYDEADLKSKGDVVAIKINDGCRVVKVL